MTRVLALDVGTSSVRAATFDASGEATEIARREYPGDLAHRSEQWETLLLILDGLVGDAGRARRAQDLRELRRGRNEFLRHRAANDLVFELEAHAGLAWFNLDLDACKLAVSAGLFLVGIVVRHDPGDLGLSELLCGPRLDEAEPAGVLRRVALKRFGVLGPQCGEGFLDGVGLLDGVGERNKRMGVHALPVHEPDLRCGLVGADDDEFRVARRLDHGGDEVVVADAVHDNGVEIDDLLDVVGPGLVIAGVNLAR